MAAVAPPRSPRVAEPPASPTARRSRPPRWRDTRLLVGLLLVLLSVVVGTRVVAGAARSDPWLTVRADLPAGHVLTGDDLGTADVRLDAASSVRYYRADSRAALIGRSLTAPVGAGALLPADAVGTGPAPASRVVPVLVRAGRLPSLRPGDRVDVYALVKAGQGGGDREVLVVAGVEFLAGETLGSGDTSAQLRVAVADAVRVVAASQSERVDLVRVDGAAPSSAASPSSTAPQSWTAPQSSTTPASSTPAVPTEAPGLGG